MIFANNFAINYEKIILGTSDTWSMSNSSQQPSNPANQHIIFNIVGFLIDCQITSIEESGVSLKISCTK